MRVSLPWWHCWLLKWHQTPLILRLFAQVSLAAQPAARAAYGTCPGNSAWRCSLVSANHVQYRTREKPSSGEQIVWGNVNCCCFGNDGGCGSSSGGDGSRFLLFCCCCFLLLLLFVCVCGKAVLKQKLLCLGGRVRFRIGRKSLLGECLLYPLLCAWLVGRVGGGEGGLERGLDRHNCVLYKSELPRVVLSTISVGFVH